MAPLVLTLLRFGFLALLWLLVLIVVFALRSDLGVGQRTRLSAQGSGGRRGRQAAQASAPVSPAAAPASASGPLVVPTRLVVVEGPTAGTELPLPTTGSLMLGRASEANLVLDDDYSSGRHARLFPQGSRWFLEDLGSTNGTYVNDVQLSRAQPVEPGQRIRIGKTVMELRP